MNICAGSTEARSREQRMTSKCETDMEEMIVGRDEFQGKSEIEIRIEQEEE